MDIMILMIGLVLTLVFLIIGTARRGMYWCFFGGMIGLISYMGLFTSSFAIDCAFCGVGSVALTLDITSSLIFLFPTLFCFFAMIVISRWGSR